MRGLLIYMILGLAFWQCQEAIDLKSKTEDIPALVVDGFITTEAKAHQIKLSTTVPFVNQEITPLTTVTGAKISILDDSGNITVLSEVEEGLYETESSFAGEEGRSYHINIILEGGTTYESIPQKIPPKGDVTNVSFEYQETEFFNTLESEIVIREEVNISVDYSFPENNSYAAFDREGTFIFKDCYVPDNLNGISPVVDNIELNVLNVENHELYTVIYNYRMREKYHLNVIMYTMDERAHHFLEQVQQQLGSNGSIFDPAPVQIQGNLFNVADDSELIMGYFGAFNKAEKGVFMWPSLLRAQVPPDFCARFPPPHFCDNCLAFLGATREEPPFWE